MLYSGKTSLLEIRYKDDPLVLSIVSADAHQIYKADKTFLKTYFDIIISVLGFQYSLSVLKELVETLPIEEYVSIGQSLCAYVGKFKEQYNFLEAIPEGSKAWVERAKIRSLIFQGDYETAETRIDNLLSFNNLNTDFCIDILWQMNNWGYLSSLVIDEKNKSYGFIKNSLQNEFASNDYFPIKSIYNRLTENQISFQNFTSRRSNYSLQPQKSLLPNEFPSYFLEEIGGENYKIGIVGATIAHLQALSDFINSGEEYCIITESDSYFTSVFDLEYLLSEVSAGGYDFVLCSDRHIGFSANPIELNLVPYIFERRASGFDGYIISKRAAVDLFNRFRHPPYSDHIDGLSIRWLSEHPQFSVGVTTVPLFAQSIFSVFSTRVCLELDY